jgi:hypothetical protein
MHTYPELVNPNLNLAMDILPMDAKLPGVSLDIP